MNADQADARCDHENDKAKDEALERWTREREWHAATGEHKSAEEIDALIAKHGVRTSSWRKPIPTDKFDWQAWRDGDEPNDNGHMLVGHGPSEMAAVADLIDSIEGMES